MAANLNGAGGQWTGPCGHTGIVISRDGDNLTIAEQNNSQYNNCATAIHTVSASTFINAIEGIIKPTGI